MEGWVDGWWWWWCECSELSRDQRVNQIIVTERRGGKKKKLLCVLICNFHISVCNVRSICIHVKRVCMYVCTYVCMYVCVCVPPAPPPPYPQCIITSVGYKQCSEEHHVCAPPPPPPPSCLLSINLWHPHLLYLVCHWMNTSLTFSPIRNIDYLPFCIHLFIITLVGFFSPSHYSPDNRA